MASWVSTFRKTGRHRDTIGATVIGGVVAASMGFGHLRKHNNAVQYTSNDADSPSPASPTLPIRFLRPNPNLEIAFDVRTRTPIYALETLTKASLAGRTRRMRPQFYEERSIEQPEYRSKLAHYKNSGWDRGHMAPSADYPDHTQDTFSLCNVAPQNHVVNLTVWNRLEEWVRRMVKSSDDTTTVYVVTGPLWLPKKQMDDTTFEYQYFGMGRPPSLIAVPTHFFKVIVTVKQNCIQQFACFVVQNHDPLPSNNLEHYLVPWKDLEAVTGLQFFPQWATPDWKDQADYLTRQVIAAIQAEENGNNRLGQSNPLLLLTDGSRGQSSTNYAWKKAKKSALPADFLQHLCGNGKCR